MVLGSDVGRRGCNVVGFVGIKCWYLITRVERRSVFYRETMGSCKLQATKII